jgi:hypothetical protein
MKLKLKLKVNPRNLWNKYGLIVVGNIVFFILLYFFSYRPHNTENRSMDLLSTAQSAETKGRNQTAHDLYEKILEDYAGTRASETAKERLSSLKKTLSKKGAAPPPDCPARCEDLNLEEMLRKEPTLYVATHMAKHYDRYPSDRGKIKEIILKNLKASYEWAKIPLKKLMAESEFQSPELKRAFFDIQPKCIVTPDWIYDDFAVQNDNFFSWTQAVIEMTVSQGNEKAQKTLRASNVQSGERLDTLEFRIKKDAGPVTCRVTVKSDQGKISTAQDL